MRKFHATQVVTGWRLQHINFKLQWSALMAEGTALLITVIVYQTKTEWLLVTRSLSPNSLQLVSALNEVENLIWEKIWNVEVTIGFSRQTTTVALPSELVKSYLSHTKRFHCTKWNGCYWTDGQGYPWFQSCAIKRIYVASQDGQLICFIKSSTQGILVRVQQL